MKIQVCKRCIMDTTADDIFFDLNGICNYCTEFIERQNKIKKNKLNIKNLVSEIKKR